MATITNILDKYYNYIYTLIIYKPRCKMRRRHNKIKIIFVIMLLITISYFAYNIFENKISIFNKNQTGNKQQEEEVEEPEPPAPKLQIIDMDSKTRPIAIMVDNELGAWPQVGLKDAYLIYEIIVEGGISRMLVLYKDADTLKIGPVRSARHYFLDYALENDAIFAHFGLSPQAERDIKLFSVNNLSGTQADGNSFWRDTSIKGWQNVFAKISALTARATTKKYRMTSEAAPLLNYSIDELDHSIDLDTKIANNIRIDYSRSHYVTYEYDLETKSYKRFMRGKAHVDRETGEQYTFKNIIVYKVKNYPLNDGSGKNRQGLNNVGQGEGYYITNGIAIPITWEKTTRKTKTIYKRLDGEELKVNDGNTFIQIQPITGNIIIE